jgi:hypothetical protein
VAEGELERQGLRTRNEMFLEITKHAVIKETRPVNVFSVDSGSFELRGYTLIWDSDGETWKEIEIGSVPTDQPRWLLSREMQLILLKSDRAGFPKRPRQCGNT